MKQIIYLGIFALLASCSSTKYAANFQKSGPSFGYGELIKSPATPVVAPENLLASTSKDAGIITSAPPVTPTAAIEQIRSQYQQLNKSERKAFRKELKRQIKMVSKAKSKTEVESVTSVKKTKVMDNDLKLAAIFGAVGVVALIIGTNAFFIIGGIALIIAAVFFVQWIWRQ